jgi:hypothetical protein
MWPSASRAGKRPALDSPNGKFLLAPLFQAIVFWCFPVPATGRKTRRGTAYARVPPRENYNVIAHVVAVGP